MPQPDSVSSYRFWPPYEVGTPQAELPSYSAIMEEALTMRYRLYQEPAIILLYTKSRWIGSIENGWIWFSNHNTALCQALWRVWMDSLEPQRPQTGFTSEAAFVAYVAQSLAVSGWDCQREVRTLYGRVDLLATCNDEIRVIEAKLSMDAINVTRALGQLLCGQEAYPTATLWFATPASIQARWNAIFTRYNIAILEGAWTK